MLLGAQFWATSMNPIFFCLCVATLALTVSVARAEDDKRVRIGYWLDQPGNISVAVYNSKGRLVRELCRGERQAAGEHFVYWDGLDQSGRALPPGECHWKFLRMPGFKASYQLTVGTSPKTQEWVRWTGNHSGVTGITVGPMVLGDSETKKRLIGHFSGWSWEGHVELEFTENYRFTTQSNDGIRVWLDGALIIDDWNAFEGGVLYQYTWNSRMDQTTSRWVQLQAGQKYSLRVEYFENAKHQSKPLAQCHLMWESAVTRQRQHIPGRFLYPGNIPPRPSK